MNIQKLKTEITDDPLARGYVSMTDKEVADDMNLVIREAAGGILGMLEYLAKNRSRTNTGTDTIATSILGRLQSVAQAADGANPFGATGNTITVEHIHAAKGFVFLLQSPQTSVFDFINTEVSIMLDALGGGAGNAKVWKTVDINALKALSQNQQSRGQELEIGNIKEGHVAQARV